MYHEPSHNHCFPTRSFTATTVFTVHTVPTVPYYLYFSRGFGYREGGGIGRVSACNFAFCAGEYGSVSEKPIVAEEMTGGEAVPATRRWYAGMPSPNPEGGRRRRRRSWQNIFSTLSQMTPAQLITAMNTSSFFDELESLPRNIQIRYLIGVQVLVKLATDPDAKLLETIMNRMDGRPASQDEQDKRRADQPVGVINIITMPRKELPDGGTSDTGDD